MVEATVHVIVYTVVDVKRAERPAPCHRERSGRTRRPRNLHWVRAIPTCALWRLLRPRA